MNLKTLYRKAFLSKYFFTIAICQKGNGIRLDRQFIPQFILPATQNIWAADPILVDYEGNTWLFYEAVEYDRGHIEVAEVREDCTLGEPTVILKDDTHYSYPFVFRRENEWYMIPESSEAKEVRLYRAVRFPEKWEPVTVLLRERAVDTTVFEQEGRYYLLTYLTDGLSERVVPKAYELFFEGTGAYLKEIPWNDYDELRVRGAGPVLREGDSLLRPAQVSQEQRYGDAVAFYRVHLSEEYRESLEFEISSDDLKITGIYTDGLHTYSASERFEAIDLRCREFDLIKPAKWLIGVFKNNGETGWRLIS